MLNFPSSRRQMKNRLRSGHTREIFSSISFSFFVLRTQSFNPFWCRGSGGLIDALQFNSLLFDYWWRKSWSGLGAHQMTINLEDKSKSIRMRVLLSSRVDLMAIGIDKRLVWYVIVPRTHQVESVSTKSLPEENNKTNMRHEMRTIHVPRHVWAKPCADLCCWIRAKASLLRKTIKHLRACRHSHPTACAASSPSLALLSRFQQLEVFQLFASSVCHSDS